jgi:hypothetical protein
VGKHFNEFEKVMQRAGVVRAGLLQTILLCLHCRVKLNLRKYSSASRKQTVDPITAVKDPYRPIREIEKTVTVQVWLAPHKKRL